MGFMQTESVLQSKNRSGPAKNRFSVALAMTLNAGFPPHGCFKTSFRQYLIVNIRKTSLIGCRIILDLIDNIKCKYKN